MFIKIRPVLPKDKMGLSNDSYLKFTDKTVKVHPLILPSSTPISRPSKGFTFDKYSGQVGSISYLMNAKHSLNGLQKVKTRLLFHTDNPVSSSPI